ncbi:sulfatase-like hydrolase/transferase [Chloroflexi bacterium TSY]|nr:sulfatase-like hydrolase/transferase [Chloroflexi bacterium TSY]
MIRNLLLLTIDSLRLDSVGCFGGRASITPNIDRFGKRSFNFTNAISCGGWTRPSLTGFFSSTYPSMYGGSWGRFHVSRPSLIERLQQHEITTGGFVSNPQVGRTYGFERGFNKFEELEPTYSGAKWAYLPGMQKIFQYPQIHQVFQMLGVRTAPPAITATAEELIQSLSRSKFQVLRENSG